MTRALWILATLSVLAFSNSADKAVAEQYTPQDIKFDLGSIVTLPKQDQERILIILRSTKLITPSEGLSVLERATLVRDDDSPEPLYVRLPALTLQ